jgi:DNA-binding LytR/AlgR family response regulator
MVEDEPLARLRLRQLMFQVAPDASCLAEAADGIEALAMLRATAADVLFLDIEFPPEGAFGLLEEARTQSIRLPPIILTTAYDRYALEAFRWAVVDYLLKPLEPTQLAKGLQRIQNAPPNYELLREALEATKAKRAPERFIVNTKSGFRVVSWNNVSHINTENRLVFVNTSEGRFVLDRTIQELEGLLASVFVRCHRSALVNMSFIKSIVVDGDGAAEALLATGERVLVSRERLGALKKALSSL